MSSDKFVKNANGWVYTGSEDCVTIPETLFGETVSEIPSGAFHGSKVLKVSLPKTVKTINKSAFLDCSNLYEINLENVIVIGNNAFSLCSSLSEVYLSDNMVKIDSYAFDQCYNLEKVRFPAKIDYIGAYAFSETALKHVELSDGISFISNSLFYQCYNLESVKMPNSVTTIGMFAFSECPMLSKINIPNGAQIHESAFAGSPNITSRIKNSEASRFNTDSIPELIIDPLKRSIKINKPVESAKSTNIQYYPPEYMEIINKGWDFVRKQEFEKALQQFNKAVELNDNYPMAYAKMGDVFYITGEYEKSVNMYYTAYILYENNEHLLKNIGHALLDAKTLDENPKMKDAVKLYRKRLLPEMFNEVISKDAEKLLLKYTKKCVSSAVEYISKNEKPMIPAAKTFVKTSENTKDTDARNLAEQGAILKRQGKYQEAKQKYIEAIRSNTQYGAAYTSLGKTLYILGEYDASVRAYKTGLELIQNTHQQDAMRHMGHALLDGKGIIDNSLVAAYRGTIDPYWAKNNPFGYRVSKVEYEKYENECIDAAKQYMSEV